MAALSQLSYSPFEIEVICKGNTRALVVPLSRDPTRINPNQKIDFVLSAALGSPRRVRLANRAPD